MINTPHFVFCPPLPGKQNPKLPPIHQVSERVAQPAQKGYTCWYYALNMIRERFGKASDQSLFKRQKEKLASLHRKKLTEIDLIVMRQKKFVEDLCQSLNIQSVTKTMARSICNSPEDMGDKETGLQLLRAFCKQSEDNDLSAYIQNQYLRDQMRLDGEFFLHFQKTPEQLYAQFKPLPQAWHHLTLKQKAWFCDNVRVFLISRECYDLEISPWHPDQPLEQLLEALRKYGPHVVFGRFGSHFYDGKPYQLNEMIAKRPVLGWRPGTPRINENDDHHAVVLVGANLDEKRIYFIDPNDASNPDAASQKVYVLSYEKFKSFLFNLRAQKIEINHKPLHLPRDDYALVNPSHVASRV